jgi:hypothetical protein
MDRPPLPVTALDDRAWTALRWRQDHLRTGRVRRWSDLDSLSHLERNAAWRLVQRLDLDDDQRYSLICHHADRVRQRLELARPDLAGLHPAPGRPYGTMVMLSFRRRRGLLNVAAGWGAWFGNRQAGLGDRWYRLRTIRHYRGAPQP